MAEGLREVAVLRLNAADYRAEAAGLLSMASAMTDVDFERARVRYSAALRLAESFEREADRRASLLVTGGERG